MGDLCESLREPLWHAGGWRLVLFPNKRILFSLTNSSELSGVFLSANHILLNTDKYGTKKGTHLKKRYAETLPYEGLFDRLTYFQVSFIVCH